MPYREGNSSTAVAVVPRETPDIQAGIVRLIAPYDLNIPVPPYRVYMDLKTARIVGGANSFVPQEDLQKMASHIPHGRYVQIPQAGHDLHMERPDLWQQTTEAFLEEVLGEAGAVDLWLDRARALLAPVWKAGTG